MQTTIQQRNWIILGLSCMTFLVSMDMIAVNLILPSLAASYKSNITDLQWVLTIYTLVSAIFAILAGKLGDMYDTRSFLIFGVVIFSIASLGAALSGSVRFLMCARAVQGLGYAFIIALSNVMIYFIYPKERVAGALGLIAGVGALAAALGPVLVGILLQYLGWRSVFMINVPIGLVSAYLLLRFSPRGALKLDRQVIDWKGALLLSISLSLLLVVLNQLHQWSDETLWILLSVGVAMGFLFVFVEQHEAHPLFHLSLLKNHIFMLANLIRLIVAYVMFSLLFVAVLFLETVFHYQPMATGSLFFIVSIAMIASAISFGRLSRLWGPYKPLIIASLILAFFFAYCAFHTESFGIIEFILYFFAGLAFGVMRPGIAHIVLRAVPEAEIGVSNAISSMVLPIGGMIGVALTGWLLSSQSMHALTTLLSAQHLHVSAQVWSLLTAMAQGAQKIDLLQNFVSMNETPTLALFVKQAFLHAYFIIMLFSAFLFLCVCLLLCLAKKQDHAGDQPIYSHIDVVV